MSPLAVRNPVRGVELFLHPESVAVIGASRNRGEVGSEILHNLIAYGFNGPVYAVNPNATAVQAIPCFPSIGAVPGQVDLAVVAVPAAAVLGVAGQCARKGVGALLVISAGFAEAGPAGAERQRELVELCGSAGMRLMGPNCMGVLNTDPAVRLNATFAAITPPAGRIGFLSQSGALGMAIFEFAGRWGLGLSSFVSIGNRADLSGNDLLEYWEDDPETAVLLLYLESFGNPRRFASIARRVARRKPIVAVKSGRGPAGVRAAASHTGALLAASDRTVDALFHQCGVIRTDTLEEMFDTAALLGGQPLPGGRRVGIVTNAGGPAILCADACEAAGLVLPPLPAACRAMLQTSLSPWASVNNPVDMVASAPADHYRLALECMAASGAYDALIAIFVPPLVTTPEAAADAIAAFAAGLKGKLPLLVVFMSASPAPASLRAAQPPLPVFNFPESAARALARVTRYALWRATDMPAPVRPPDLDAPAAAALIAAAQAANQEWLTAGQARDLLACYGLAQPAQAVVAGVEEAVAFAASLPAPVVVKAVAPTLVHKSDLGLVALNLSGADAVRSAAVAIQRRAAAAGIALHGLLVQATAPPGVEMIAGFTQHPGFGPVLACGAGGVAVEILQDIAVRLAPVSADDAMEMIRELRTFPLLNGFRGALAGNLAALADALVRVSWLAADHPAIREMDANPVIVGPASAIVADARFHLR